jgi:hypothetical protein
MVLFMGAQRWDRMVFVAGTTKRWCGGATGSVLRWSASGPPPSRPRDAPAFWLTGTQRFVVFGGITSSRWPARPRWPGTLVQRSELFQQHSYKKKTRLKESVNLRED